MQHFFSKFNIHLFWFLRSNLWPLTGHWRTSPSWSVVLTAPDTVLSSVMPGHPALQTKASLDRTGQPSLLCLLHRCVLGPGLQGPWDASPGQSEALWAGRGLLSWSPMALLLAPHLAGGGERLWASAPEGREGTLSSLWAFSGFSRVSLEAPGLRPFLGRVASGRVCRCPVPPAWSQEVCLRRSSVRSPSASPRGFS